MGNYFFKDTTEYTEDSMNEDFSLENMNVKGNINV